MATDNQIVRYQSAAMASLGIQWTFAYRAAGGTYKWEFVGGPPWYANVEGSSSVTGTAWTNTDLSITPPRTGDYLFYASCIGSVNSAGSSCEIMVGTGGNSTLIVPAAGTGYWGEVGRWTRINGVSGAQYMRLRSGSAGVTATIQMKSMLMIPVRVS